VASEFGYLLRRMLGRPKDMMRISAIVNASLGVT
jgi:hypothetical protein